MNLGAPWGRNGPGAHREIPQRGPRCRRATVLGGSPLRKGSPCTFWSWKTTPGLAEALARILEDNGYTTDVVHDGEAGVRYGETGTYDVIILDVNAAQSRRLHRWPKACSRAL